MTIGPIPLRVDVSTALPDAPPQSVGAWVFAPDRPPRDGRTAVVFAFPGGGYSKSYFHMDPTAYPSYSMAAYLAGRGHVFVACDNLAAGDSSRPPPEMLTWQAMARAYDLTIRAVLGLLDSTDLLPYRIPAARAVPVGLGHSLGAGLVTVAQAAHRPFAGLVILGRTLRANLIPAPPDLPGGPPRLRPMSEQHAEFAASSELVEGYPRQLRRTGWQRYLFYWDDVPETVIAGDDAASTTFPIEVARRLGGPDGPNDRAAAAIDVPILLGFGQRDLSPDPRAEVAAYERATDIQLFVLPGSGHCQNLASTRVRLWDRVDRWTRTLTGAAY